MRVLQIIETLNIGGAENFTVQLSNELCASNEVIVVVTRNSNEHYNFISTLNGKIGLKELKWKKKYSLKQVWHLNKVINDIKPDIIHVHLHNSFYYVFALSILHKKWKIVHTVHNSIEVWKIVQDWVNKLRFLSNSITHVCISKSISADFRKNYPKLKECQINNGIKPFIVTRKKEDLHQFWKEICGTIEPEACIKFLAIGNISRFKNFILLARALKQIEQKYPNVKCAIVGRSVNQNLTDEINSLKSQNLKLMGAFTNAADFLTGADALIISSSEEGMPIVALEALSLSKPIISTPAGGMVDIVSDGYNGFISKDFEIDSYIKTIENYLSLSKSEIEEMQKNAGETFAKNYQIEKISKKYFDLYTNVVEN
ncbi:MAG TPA: glycosyltransferase [Bacteroidia bacterium]|jgi:glycosyltransferase involved in cell wall biosynthesis|nr:glycosyltransferase [Bacteroidia bacterium]